MSWTLEYRGGAPVPLELEGILPERLVDLSLKQIAELPIVLGNRQVSLGEFFSVQSAGDDLELRLSGDLTGVHWVGAKMSRGTLRVDGAVGRHVGSEMTGGQIHVTGDAGDWVGAEMKGGLIHVGGRAGHLVGAAYRGSRRGMTGGTILIDRGVGNEIGHTMRRGTIAVGGDAGDLIGFNLLAGTILVLGPVGIRHGAGMKRGTLVLLHSTRVELLPSFRHACRFRPPMLPLLRRYVDQIGFHPENPFGSEADEQVDLFHGDLLTGGRGEILMSAGGELA